MFETNDYVISDKSDEKLEIDQQAIDSDSMRLKNMTNCQIRITAKLKTVYLNNIMNCKVIIFPTENSIFGDEIKDSEIYCCAQQIRIHHTERTKFSIFVSSSMIIEDRYLFDLFNEKHCVASW